VKKLIDERMSGLTAHIFHLMAALPNTRKTLWGREVPGSKLSDKVKVAARILCAWFSESFFHATWEGEEGRRKKKAGTEGID